MAADLSFDVIARDQASRVLDKVGDSAEQAGRDLEGIGDRAESGGRRVSGMFAKIGPGLATAAGAVGVAAGAALLAGISEALENEKATAKLTAQLDLTPAESERIGKIAGKLYANAYAGSMGEATDAVAAAMSSIKGMTNASSAELEKAAADASNFARTFDIEVAAAARYAGTVLETGLAKDAQHAFDLIAAASTKVPAAVREDVLEAADEYGQFFHTIGLSGEQAFGLLVSAAAKGRVEVDKIGDAVKEFTLLATDLDHAGDAYKKIGLNARQMSNAILAGGDRARDAYGKIIDGLLKIKDPSEQAAAAIKFFGTPLEDLNKSEIPQFLRAMADMGAGLEGVDGAMNRVADNLNNNLGTRLDELKARAKLALADIGEAVIKAFEDMTPEQQEQWRQLGEDVAAMGKAFADFIASEDGKETIEQLRQSAVYVVKLTEGVMQLGFWMAEANNAAMNFADGLQRKVAVVILEALGSILAGATHAFSWIPGLGPKLEAASKKFAQFQARANRALAGIEDETVNVDVNLRGITNLEEQMAVRLGRREHGGPVKRGEAYIVGEKRAELFVPDRDGMILPQVPTQGQMQAMGLGAGGPTVIEIRSGGTALDDLLTQFLLRAMRNRPDLRVAMRTAVG